MPTVTVNGLDLHYREAGSGIPLFLIHGHTGSSRSWEPCLPVLSRHYRVIAPDLPGHGLSGRPGDPAAYAPEAMAEALYGLMEGLGLERCHLAGHSMGGMIAMLLALAYPERLRSLMLISTSAEAPETARTPGRARVLQIAREQGMEAAWEALQTADYVAAARFPDRPDLVQLRREQFLMTAREAFIYCSEAVSKHPPFLQDLERLSLPALIVCGEDDTYFVEPSRRMHQHLRGSQLVFMPGCGHRPQFDRTEEFNRIVLDFLQRVDAASGA